MSEEKRIYVVVPKTVQVSIEPELLKGLVNEHGAPLCPPDERILITKLMVCGRAMAQVAHATSAMRSVCGIAGEDEITTIVLSCRNSKELEFLFEIASRAVDAVGFSDTNPEFYETEERVRTVFCTRPVEPERVEGFLGHLPLWACGKDC